MSEATITTEAYVARPGGSTTLEPITLATPRADEVLVDIVGAAICHTDVRAIAGAFMPSPPLVPGHEAAGYVRVVGARVAAVAPGDAVVLAYDSCARCRRCLAGRQPYCDLSDRLNFGGGRLDGSPVAWDAAGAPVKALFFGQSSMARAALVREGSVVKVEGLREEELRRCAALGCGMQTGAGTILNVAKPPPGSNIVVFGGGAVGLSAVMAAKLTGPHCLVLVDNSATKLASLPPSLLDGIHTINSADTQPGEVAAQLKQLSGGRGMDYALDCVGREAVLKEGHASLDTLGTLFSVGSSLAATPGFAIGLHLKRGITFRGTHQGDSVSRIMIPQLIDLWRRGKFPFEQLLQEFKFEELDKALEEMREGRVVKPLLIL